MAPRYDEAPEVALHPYPEVHYPPQAPELTHGYPTRSATLKREDSTIHHGYAGTDTIGSGTYLSNGGTPIGLYAPPMPPASNYGYDHQSAYGTTIRDRENRRRRLCGCSLLVFTLSVIIAILSATVIGLAAGTGVATSRASDAEAQLASATTSPGATKTVTVTAPTSTSTSGSSDSSDFSSIDKGCETDSNTVTGTVYTSQFYNQPSFKLFCNSDTPNSPLSSLFVANYDDCIDACASWSFYVVTDFSAGASKNQTCAGVSFIPAWTNRTFAFDGGAPGNCYLKPGPQNSTALTQPNIGGSAVHAAILQQNE